VSDGGVCQHLARDDGLSNSGPAFTGCIDHAKGAHQTYADRDRCARRKAYRDRPGAAI